MFKFQKIGFLKKDAIEPISGWITHIMAPTVRQKPNGDFEIFCGGWDEKRISRIYKFDIHVSDKVSYRYGSANLALDVGARGCFDDNGVFPAHLSSIKRKNILFYSGFQLANNEINHRCFGGGCLVDKDSRLTRIAESPLLVGSPEGTLVRAGQSSIFYNREVYTVYSAGSSSCIIGEKKRPVYDIFIQIGVDPLDLNSAGTRLIRHDPAFEHGLGRPQLLTLKNRLTIFYTRRDLDLNYSFGYAFLSEDKRSVTKYYPNLDSIAREGGLDDEMIYFPAVTRCKVSNRKFVFYSGNNFGEQGMGILELKDV